MRGLFKLISLLLCFELIVSPIAPGLSLVGTKAFAQGSCPAGMQYDSTLNRCLTSAETAKVMNATQSCGSDVECYKNNAKNAFQEQVNQGKAPERKGNAKFFSTVTQIGAVAMPVTIAATALSTKKAMCWSLSHVAMIAAALAIVVGENLANHQHAKRLKGIKDDWSKIVDQKKAAGDKDQQRDMSMEAQGEAFEMLARSEDSLASAAKMKKNIFNIATLAYGTTAAIAAFEIIKETMARAAVAKTSAAATKSCTSAAAIVSPGSASLTTAATQSTAAGAASKLTGEDRTLASATSMQTAAASAVTAAAASVPLIATALATASAAVPVSAPLVATLTSAQTAAQACVTAVGALQTASTALFNFKKAHTCTPVPVAGNNYKKDEALYSLFSGGQKRSIKEELQFRYNIAHSKDLASFLMNQREMQGEIADPLAEFEIYKKDVQKTGEDRTVLEILKYTTLTVLDQMNPIASAHADQAVQQTEVPGAEASGGTGGSLITPNGASSANLSSGRPNDGSNIPAGGVSFKTFEDDKAEGFNWLGIIPGLAAGVIVARTTLGQTLLLAKGRLIYSGVMGGMTFIMAKHAGSQQEASEKRAELLRKMKADLLNSYGAVYNCRSEDRQDPSKPNCYCYTPDGERNNNRGNSQTCQNLWGQQIKNGGNYLAAVNSKKVCVTQQGKADAACACKKNNSCMKVSAKGFSGMNAGTLSMLNSGLTPLNSLLNGSSNGATVNDGGTANLAARMNQLNDSLARDPAVASALKNRAAEENQIRSDLNKAGAGLSPSGLFGSAGNAPMPSNPKEAAAALEKELTKTFEPQAIPGSQDTFAVPVSEAEPTPEFGVTPEEALSQDSQLAEVMNQDMDYGGNEINNSSSTNIFEVLSNRYQRSGMRRLFDENGTTEAEKPSTSDISQ